jgi:DnaJ-class molecular chaperone
MSSDNKDTDQSYYDILEVLPDAPHHEIVAAYQRAREAYAPDSAALYTMFTREEAEEIRRMVDEAFSVLGNSSKRREYDFLLTGIKRAHIADGGTPKSQTSAQQFKGNSVHKLESAMASATTAHSVNRNPSEPLPEGHARSKISVYKIDPEMDKTIATCKLFDGLTLKRIREYKNISLELMSKETRISRTYISALESDDFSELPATVFIRGFIVQVARALALDETVVVSSYMDRLKK